MDVIWFNCKQCNKTHGRPESAVGSMVFCECGQGNMVPWESSVPEPGPLEVVEPLPVVPALAPLKFEVDPPPARESPRARDADQSSERSAGRPPLSRPAPRRRAKPKRDPNFCFNHDSIPTHEPCADCKEGFCSDCLVVVQGKSLCGPCKNFRSRALHQPLPTSQLAMVSMLLALVAAPLVFFFYAMGTSFGTHKLGLVALLPQLAAVFLGCLALRAIEKDPKIGGQALALTGILMGTFATFWTIFVTLYGPRLGA